MFANSDICEVFLCIVCLGFAHGSVIITPNNTAVVAGNWMAMECGVTNESTIYRWTLTKPTSTKKEFLFTNDSKGPKINSEFLYGIDADERGSGLLYLNETQLDDAGLYTCYTFVGKERHQQQHSAQLVVLESNPLCETNYTAEDNATLRGDETIWMQCTVNFRGMWAPTFEWKQHTVDETQGEGDEQIVVHGISTDTVLNSSVTTSLVFVADLNQITYFSCRMFFQWHNGSVMVKATNLPNFTYTWKSPRLQPDPEKMKPIFVVPVPVEGRPLDTTTPTQNGSNDWYVISVILLFAVLVFVSLLTGLGIRRYVRLRRDRDLNLIYNPSNSSTAPMRRLEGQFAIEYDIVPGAAPNIYERIDGAEAEDDVAAKTSCRSHPPLTECYSVLMVADGNATTCQYDTLDQYAKMEILNVGKDQDASQTSGCPSQGIGEERYTTPVPKGGVTKPKPPSGSGDYLDMVRDARVPKMPVYVDVRNDSDEDYMQPYGQHRAFKKSSDDYLHSGPKALDNCPRYVLTDRVITE